MYQPKSEIGFATNSCIGGSFGMKSAFAQMIEQIEQHTHTRTFPLHLHVRYVTLPWLILPCDKQ